MVQPIPGKDKGSRRKEFKTDHNVSGWGNSVNKVKKFREYQNETGSLKLILPWLPFLATYSRGPFLIKLRRKEASVMGQLSTIQLWCACENQPQKLIRRSVDQKIRSSIPTNGQSSVFVDCLNSGSKVPRLCYLPCSQFSCSILCLHKQCHMLQEPRVPELNFCHLSKIPQSSAPLGHIAWPWTILNQPSSWNTTRYLQFLSSFQQTSPGPNINTLTIHRSLGVYCKELTN